MLPWGPAHEDVPLLVHSADHVRRVSAYARAGGGWFDADTYCTRDSLDAALAATGASIRAVDAVMDSEARAAFVVCRPPGHHATRDRAMGFCLFNNIAICAAHARRRGAARIAIVDIDVHHGNGTQDIFYNDPSVLYCSLHQSPWYPGTGSANERGDGDALNTTLNVPVPFGTGGDAWLGLFESTVVTAVDAFAPDLILVSAGFDAHEADPLAGLRLTDETYSAVAGHIKQLAGRHAGGRNAWLLEGGYDLDALASSVTGCLRVLASE